jgi:ketol-acid reductoisomerase
VTESTTYYDSDADLSVLDDATVAMIGYGNQGRSQALNLRDSGVEVVVGNRDDEYRERIEDDGFEALSIADAAERGDVICLLIPDEVAPEVFDTEIEPGLDEGNAIYVSHGYNLTYDLLQPPETADVVLVAPRMGGWAVRELYESGDGFPSVLAVEQDYTGDAKATALAMAKGIGSTRAGVIEGTADMETKIDLLSEQALLPIMMAAMTTKFEVEVAHGIPPKIVMSELYLSYEMAEIFEEMAERGYLGQLPFHSRTSQYGQLSRFDQFDPEPLREFYEEQLQGIDNGSFAREWSAEQELDRPGLKRLYKKYRNSAFFKAERETMERLDFGAEDDA